ncbi:MAG: thiol-disulfide oxidoreductase DCC family protein [Verrucomicrobiales bacterium]
MTRLYVFYDGECDLCQRCRAWLLNEPAFVLVVFIPFQTALYDPRFVGLEALSPEREMIVVSDDGSIWQGGAAWLMCLWALKRYRTWAQRLAARGLLPFVRKIVEMISRHRLKISANI